MRIEFTREELAKVLLSEPPQTKRTHLGLYDRDKVEHLAAYLVKRGMAVLVFEHPIDACSDLEHVLYLKDAAPLRKITIGDKKQIIYSLDAFDRLVKSIDDLDDEEIISRLKPILALLKKIVGERH